MRRWLWVLCLLCCGRAMCADRNVGSATVLEGKVYVLTIFIGEQPFPPEEQFKFMARLEEAERWLQRQAARYGKQVEFLNDYCGRRQTVLLDRVVVGRGTGKESVDILMPVLQKLGYAHHRQLYNHVQSATPCQSCVVLLVADVPGRSYSLGYVEGAKDCYFTECCMLYTHYTNGKPAYAASVAHEILHCFGAWDLYENFRVSSEQAAEAKIKYRNDVMRRIMYRIDKLEVSPLTAWRVGWIDDPQPEFEFFRPRSRRTEKK